MCHVAFPALTHHALKTPVAFSNLLLSHVSAARRAYTRVPDALIQGLQSAHNRWRGRLES